MSMSYTLTLHCGCIVYVACDPTSGIAHTRIIERRGSSCAVRRHEVGLRLYLWELLPERVPAGAIGAECGGSSQGAAPGTRTAPETHI